jgi:hypothetical protein
MESDDGKYQKVIGLLKRSNPDPGSTLDIEQNVLSAIMNERKYESSSGSTIDIIFSWTSIKWVRYSLVTASVALVLLFVFQQSIIMREISQVNRIIIENGNTGYSPDNYEFERRAQLLNLSGKKLQLKQRELSDRKVKELLESIDKLGRDYQELRDVIDANPELRKLIEKKMAEVNENKIKL